MSTKTQEKSTCGKCGLKWVPDFSMDCFDIDGVTMCESCAMPYLMKSRKPEPVDEDRVRNICRRGQGEATCAFLVMSSIFACAKYSSLEGALRQRLQEGSIRSKGDNCSGPPAFKILTTI